LRFFGQWFSQLKRQTMLVVIVSVFFLECSANPTGPTAPQTAAELQIAGRSAAL